MIPEQCIEDGVYRLVFALPPKALAVNGTRGWHWSIKSKASKVYQNECLLVIQTARVPVLRTPIKMDFEFYHAPCAGDGLYRAYDEENALAGSKKLRDAFELAGVIPSDSRKYLKIGNIEIYGRAKEHKGFAGILVTITEDFSKAQHSTV